MALWRGGKFDPGWQGIKYFAAAAASRVFAGDTGVFGNEHFLETFPAKIR